MAKDGVSGCVGGGCGGLSLIGLLIGVGLTVWLGSIAMNGGLGGHDNKASGRTSVSSVLATSTTLAPTAAITVRPATDLAEGATVTVSSAAFPAGTKVRVSTCLSRATLATGTASLCDETTTSNAVVDRNGHLILGYKVVRAITVNNVPFDCAEKAGACVVTATSTVDGSKHGSVPLTFTDTGRGPEITLPN